MDHPFYFFWVRICRDFAFAEILAKGNWTAFGQVLHTAMRNHPAKNGASSHTRVARHQ
jgi:hypothetical protein